MILHRPLTDEERTSSQRNYNLYNLVNGASYTCLGEMVVVLFAVALDMPNHLTNTIGAMTFLGFLLVPLGIRRTGQVGAAQCQADFWVCRNIAILMVALSAVVALFSKTASWIVLLIGCFLFFGFRAAGIVLNQPMIGEITTPEDRSNLIGVSQQLFYGAGFAILLAVIVILHFTGGIVTLCGIIVAGAIMGLTAAMFLRKIYETDVIRNTARAPMLPQLLEVFRSSTTRRIIAAGIASNMSMILTAIPAALALKKGYGVSNATAVIFSALMYLGAVIASYFLRKVPRKALANAMILGYATSLLICLAWAFAPPAGGFLPFLFAGILFLLQGFLWMFPENVLICYFLMETPPDKQVPTALAFNVIRGVGAGLIGLFLAGFLMKIAAHFVPDGAAPMQGFRIYFLMALAILAILLIPILRMDAKRGRKRI